MTGVQSSISLSMLTIMLLLSMVLLSLLLLLVCRKRIADDSNSWTSLSVYVYVLCRT